MSLYLNPDDGVEACLARVDARWRSNVPVPVTLEEVAALLEAVQFLSSGIHVLMDEHRKLLTRIDGLRVALDAFSKDSP